MARILIIFVLLIHNAPVWSQSGNAENLSDNLVLYADDKSSAEGIVSMQYAEPSKVFVAETLALNPDGTFVRASRTITSEQLPKAVTYTLETRNYNRGFMGDNFKEIENTQGAMYYSLDLISDQTMLFVMLYADGRVFKAALQ